GLIVGIGPARMAARGEFRERLRGARQSAHGGDLRLRRTLVAAELGVATVLLTGALLLVNTVRELRRVDPGFRADQVVSFRTQLPSIAYPNGDAISRFYSDLIERIGRLPGVEGSAAAMLLPL